jgi:hypothetical protein
MDAWTVVAGALLPLPHATDSKASNAMKNHADSARRDMDGMRALQEMKELPSWTCGPSHLWCASIALGNKKSSPQAAP